MGREEFDEMVESASFFKSLYESKYNELYTKGLVSDVINLKTTPPTPEIDTSIDHIKDSYIKSLKVTSLGR